MDSTKRCDACGAQAYVVFILTVSGRELLFCGNHWTRNKPALQGKGVWDDDALTKLYKDAREPVVVDA